MGSNSDFGVDFITMTSNIKEFDGLIESGRKLMSTARMIDDLIRPNKIPKDYHGIMELKQKLEREEKEKEEMKNAISYIKKIQEQRNDERYQRKMVRRSRIKSVLDKLKWR